jgi:HEAT repeat protein
VIRRYGIGAEVASCRTEAFRVDDKDVHLVLLSFGRAMDCPEGCIYSTYCAVVEDGVDYPFTFYLNQELGGLSDDWRYVEPSVLTGRDHRVTRLLEFQRLVNDEGVWAACSGLSEPERQMATAQAQLGLQVVPESIPVLITTLLSDPDWENRNQAAVALGLLGTGEGDVVAALTQALGDEHSRVRLSVVGALQQIGPDAEGVVRALVQAMQDGDPEIRAASIDVLRTMGPLAAEAVPALIDVVHDADEDANVRAGAIWALDQMESETTRAIPALIQSLEDESYKVRGIAVTVLKRMGPDAVEAIPALIKVLEEDENEAIRADAAWAIRAIKPDAVEAVPALTEVVKVDYWQLQREAIQTLRGMGSKAKSAVPVLIWALEDDDWQVREAAVGALREITGQDHGTDPGAWRCWWEKESLR